MSNKRPILKLNKNSENIKDVIKVGNIKLEENKEINTKADMDNLRGVKEKQAISLRKFPISKEKYKEILKLLRNTYPECFTIPSKPFAIGIHKELYDLQHERLTKTAIRHFLKIYCSRKEYKDALTVGSTRVNLDGNASSLVTEEETAMQRKKVDNDNHI